MYEVLNGRVGAINVEQLDELLLSLKAYWEYGENSTRLYEFAPSRLKVVSPIQESPYEL